MGAKKQSGRASDWLAQAESDFAFAKDSLRTQYYSQVCFICQQVAEKALKALAYKREYNIVRGHSVIQLANELKINGKLKAAASRLDQYYITARYPDALPSGAPFQLFTADQAREAIEFAELILENVLRKFGQERDSRKTKA